MFAIKVAASLCLCASVIAIYGNFPTPKLLSKFDENTCLLKINASQNEVRDIERGFLPVTEKQRCLLTCLWKKVNVMTSKGQFVEKNMIDYIRLKYELSENRMKFVGGPVHNCYLKAKKKNLVECDLGGYMYKCMTEHRKEIFNLPNFQMPKKVKFLYDDTLFERIQF